MPGSRQIVKEILIFCLASSSSHRKIEIPMQWSQLDLNVAHANCFSLKIFSLLYLNANVNFVAGPWSWLGLSSHWGHGLATSSSHQKVEIQMKWSPLDPLLVITDSDWLKTSP